MKILIFILVVLPAVSAENWQCCQDRCEACIHNQCYHRQIKTRSLTSGRTLVRVLAVDYKAKIIYCEVDLDGFGKTIGAYRESTGDIEYFGDDNMKGPIAATVDQKSHDVYVSSLEVNYKFNRWKTPVFYSDNETKYLYNIKSMEHLQYQNTLFLSFSNYSGIYTLGNNSLSNYLSGYYVKEFVVDKNDVLYYRINDKLYKFSDKTLPITFVSSFSTPYFKLSVDKYGEAYIKAGKYLYKISDEKPQEMGIFDFDVDFRPIFDWNHNLIYVGSGTLYFLKPRIHKQFQGLDLPEMCTYANGLIERY